MQETENGHKELAAPYVDFSMQFCLARNDEKFEQEIFDLLVSVAGVVDKGVGKSIGALVVFGDFMRCPQVNGMVQMKPKQNPIESLKMIDTEAGKNCILKYSDHPYDGAVVVDISGQVIGAGIYLVVDDPTLVLSEDCGTRHKAAASFSLRNDVISVLTLSEETNTVRIWKDGNLKKIYRAEDENNEQEK